MMTRARHAVEYQICYACDTAFRLYRQLYLSKGDKRWAVSVLCSTYGSEDITYFDDYSEAHDYWRRQKSCPCLKAVPV